MSWITKSNRWEHLTYSIPVGLCFTILCVLGVASALELKDWLYGRRWDWLDWLATIIGGVIGQALQILIIYALWLR